MVSVAQNERSSAPAGRQGVQCHSTRRAVSVLGLLGAGVLVSGCARQGVEPKVAYLEADHKAYLGKGTATVDGEGFLRRPNGLLARCSGGTVQLMPASPYFRERLQIFRSGGITANQAERRDADAKLVRNTQCDSRGRFLFTDIPAGKWLVVTKIGYESDSWSSNSTLATELETRPGEVTKVILSDPNRI